MKEDKKVNNNKFKLEAAKKNINNEKIKIIFKSKITYIVIIVTILILSITTFLLILYVNTLKYKPYIRYEEKMKIYGFDTMYNNKSAKTDELVSKGEALKLVLAATFNTYNISDFAVENNDYLNSTWTEYAESAGIIKEDINPDNFNANVKYIDVISYFEESKKKFLENYPIKDIDLKLKDLSIYKNEEQIAIKDMVANKIIELVPNKLNGNEYIFKGKLNELVINFVEQFNTITNSDEKININPEKIPSNSSQYPYTLASVDKEIYEKEFTVLAENDYYSPAKLYTYKKDHYKQVQTFAEEYFNNLLNIDYNTITVESFKESLRTYLIFDLNQTFCENYVKHVKDNKIIINGSAKQIVPVFYFDGLSYRIRMKLNFEIKSSNTKNNIIYLDFISGLSKTYEKNNYEIYVDYYLTDAIGANNIYMEEFDLYGGIIDKKNCGIIEEEYKEINDVEENK
ncbi:MAG: hypothetical protein RR290_00950 [Clostridia bacterium]